MTLSTRVWLRRVIFATQFPLTLALGVYNVTTTTNAQWWQSWHMGRVVRFCQATYLLAVPAVIIALLLVQLLLSWIEPPQVLRAAKAVLDELHKIAFGNHDDLPEYERRVTLFKYGGFPLVRRLRAIARSGDTTQTKISTFRVSLNRPAKAEGIAGQAFATGQVKNTGLLPEVDGTSSPQDIAAYAARTYVDAKWIRNWLSRRPFQRLPRGICAIPVRDADGKPWGVLVLDASIEIKYTREASKKNFLMVASVLGKLLGGRL
jgi:hypothetical protein